MLDPLVIGTAQRADPLRRRLDRELEAWQQERAEGPVPQLSQHARGAWTFFVLRWPRPAAASRSAGPTAADPAARALRTRLARTLTLHIDQDYRWQLAQRLLRRRYGHLAAADRRSVMTFLRKQADAQKDRVRERQRLLNQRLRAYLQTDALLLVEGFLRFRCRDYVEELEHWVDRAVDEFLLEREYRDFVRLLRQFVDVQVPHLDRVHVLLEAAGRFQLVDDDGTPVPFRVEGQGLWEGTADPGDPDDVLLSTLITLGARRLVVHAPQTRLLRADTRQTLEQVFGDRVELCRGCDRCHRRNRRPVRPAP